MYIDPNVLSKISGQSEDEIKETIDGFASNTPNHADYFNHVLEQLLNNDLTVYSQATEKADSQLVSTSGRIMRDIAALAFELQMNNLTNNDQVKNVFVDTIDSADDIEIVEGNFDASGKVYI